jgi:uncharacterized protein HemX
MPQHDLPTTQQPHTTKASSNTVVLLNFILTLTAIGMSFYALSMIRKTNTAMDQSYSFTAEQAQRISKAEQAIEILNQEQGKMITGLSLLDQTQKNFATQTQQKEEQTMHWLLQDANYTINAAAQQLYIFGDVQQAAGQLQNLAQYLATSSDARLLPLRQMLNKDIEALMQYPSFDATATHLRLAQLSQTAQHIAFHLDSKSHSSEKQDTAVNPSPSVSIPSLAAVMANFKQSLTELVQIRTLNRPETLVLTPEQQFLFQQNILLDILGNFPQQGLSLIHHPFEFFLIKFLLLL